MCVDDASCQGISKVETTAKPTEVGQLSACRDNDLRQEQAAGEKADEIASWSSVISAYLGWHDRAALRCRLGLPCL